MRNAMQPAGTNVRTGARGETFLTSSPRLVVQHFREKVGETRWDTGHVAPGLACRKRKQLHAGECLWKSHKRQDVEHLSMHLLAILYLLWRNVYSVPGRQVQGETLIFTSHQGNATQVRTTPPGVAAPCLRPGAGEEAERGAFVLCWWERKSG